MFFLLGVKFFPRLYFEYCLLLSMPLRVADVEDIIWRLSTDKPVRLQRARRRSLSLDVNAQQTLLSGSCSGVPQQPWLSKSDFSTYGLKYFAQTTTRKVVDVVVTFEDTMLNLQNIGNNMLFKFSEKRQNNHIILILFVFNITTWPYISSRRVICGIFPCSSGLSQLFILRLWLSRDSKLLGLKLLISICLSSSIRHTVGRILYITRRDIISLK